MGSWLYINKKKQKPRSPDIIDMAKYSHPKIVGKIFHDKAEHDEALRAGWTPDLTLAAQEPTIDETKTYSTPIYDEAVEKKPAAKRRGRKKEK